MKNLLMLFSLIAISFTSCIQDDIIEDFVEPTIRITTTPETILVGTEYQFEFMYLNNIGKPESVTPTWSSSDESILTINQNGLANPTQKGSVTITVTYSKEGIDLQDSFIVNIGEVFVDTPQAKSGFIATTGSYILEGNFEIIESDGKLIITFAENYAASSILPGLYVYLTNNTTTTSGAYEIGKVDVFEGSHVYEIDGIGINEYSHLLYFCKPFNVKVGDGEIK